MVKQWSHVPYSWKPQPKYSLLQLGVMILLIVVLIIFASRQIWALRGTAERTGVAHLIGTLQSALGNEMAVRVIRGGTAALLELEGSNPITLLKAPPANYGGALDHPDPASIPGNQWYFDRHDGTLVYRIAYDEGFESPLTGPSRIRLRVVARFVDGNRNGQLDHPAETLTGMGLVPIDPYRWGE